MEYKASLVRPFVAAAVAESKLLLMSGSAESPTSVVSVDQNGVESRLDG